MRSGGARQPPAGPDVTNLWCTVRSNVLTRFNLIISVLAGVVLAVGSPVDALFAGVMVLNALVGIVQEIRAKRTLDRLRILVAPMVTVRRDGETSQVPPEQVVLGDLLALTQGDQVPVDGTIVRVQSLEVDESLADNGVVIVGIGHGPATDAAVHWAAHLADDRDLPVGLVRATGEGPVFQVDGLLSLLAYYIDPRKRANGPARTSPTSPRRCSRYRRRTRSRRVGTIRAARRASCRRQYHGIAAGDRPPPLDRHRAPARHATAAACADARSVPRCRDPGRRGAGELAVWR